MTEHDFETLVVRIRPELVRIAARRCGRDNAEDAVQKAITQVWLAGRWATYPTERTTGLLRQAAARKGINELRGLGRLRAAQTNLAVLGNKGHKHANPAAYRDRSNNHKGEGDR